MQGVFAGQSQLCTSRVQAFKAAPSSSGAARQAAVQVVAQKRVTKKQQVILVRDVPGLGSEGSLKSVPVGYFRNYLQPQGLAAFANAGILDQIKRQREEEERARMEEKAKAQAMATALATIGKFIVKKKVGEKEAIFGSVTTQEIVDAIKMQTGRELEKKNVTLPEIKSLGTYDASIKMHPEVTGFFKVAAKGGGLPARAKPAAAAPAPTSDGTAAAAPAAADDAAAKRGGAAAAAGGGGAAPSRPSLKGSTSRAGLLKQANYAERRQAWRQRIEAIKAKQASRATAAAGDAPPGAAAGNAAGSGSRVFSKHVAIPLTAGGARGGGIAGGSTHGTPYGSPSRRELLHEAATLPQLEAPPVWQGFQTAEVPSDLGAASEEQLRRFLQQAGWAAEAAAALPDHESLVAAAHAARGAWSVERIMACTWPEEVLRVPRKCADVAVLRAAYRRCSMAVHPDKCTAQGASDAFAILGDCYNVLLAAASGGKAPAAVPAFMRAAAPSRAGAVHGSSSGSNLAAASAAAGPGGGTLPPGAGQRRQTTGHPAGAARQPSLDAELEQGGMRHSRHASVESFFAASDVHVWTEQQQQADQARQQQQAGEADQQPSRASSIGGEAGLPRDASASSHEHWNPHAHFSSEDAEGGAYAVVPPPAPRSRSSSTSSFAAAVAAGPALLRCQLEAVRSG
ncbi:50S ribosomal L9 [Micractinium conductrix]|uniref:Large ribosomal subunit protein bL9c n=1 Tax=Micractinium conductrix TaxID=554055 RepID=A0A2P6VS68_9CHLO|nr:50S ribosomal L9 [Micractinium conductrix]|eukprot:PSC76948.1 50S ribosomal L9 [Micractinium conductrix]